MTLAHIGEKIPNPLDGVGDYPVKISVNHTTKGANGVGPGCESKSDCPGSTCFFGPYDKGIKKNTSYFYEVKMVYPGVQRKRCRRIA